MLLSPINITVCFFERERFSLLYTLMASLSLFIRLHVDSLYFGAVFALHHSLKLEQGMPHLHYSLVLEV